MATKKEREKLHAKEQLLRLLKKGDTIYSVIRHVSRTGMSRRIDFYVFKPNAAGRVHPYFLTGYMAKVLGYTHHRQGGLVVGGCGMDMAFHCVNSLCYALWGYEDRDAERIEDKSGYQLDSYIL